jgi:stage V sporulation protein R
MTEKALEPAELVDYADHHAGTLATAPGQLNPYRLGVALWRDIEERYDKGRFGKAYEECDSLAERQRWDTGHGRGREKIFEVRRHYNDVTFLDEFLTADFCAAQRLFSFGYSRSRGRWEVQAREFAKVKERLLSLVTNCGQPVVTVEDGNHDNRGELLLHHHHEGADLRQDWARDTLENLAAVWRRPVCLRTRVEDRPVLMRHDGKEHSARRLDA